MGKYYIYTGNGTKIYGYSNIKLVKRRAKKLSLLRFNDYSTFVILKKSGKAVAFYYKGK